MGRLATAILRAVLTAAFGLWDLIGRPENRFARGLWAVLAAVLVVDAYATMAGIAYVAFDRDPLAVEAEQSISTVPEDDYATDWSALRSDEANSLYDDDDVYDELYSGAYDGGADFGFTVGFVFSEMLSFLFLGVIAWFLFGGLATLIENTHQIRKANEPAPPSGA